MEHTKVCTFCHSPTHTAFSCRNRRHAWPSKKKPLRPESKVHNERRAITRRQWFIENPRDEAGGYQCYLQISPVCPGWVASGDVTLEHVYPKALYPELRYMTINIKPSCIWCNKLKGRNTLEKLALFYPSLYPMLESAEWLAWEAEVAKFIKPELH